MYLFIYLYTYINIHMPFFIPVKRIGNSLNTPQREINTLQYIHTRKHHAVTKNYVFGEILITKMSYNVYF